jgi:protein required for attachment to host cells
MEHHRHWIVTADSRRADLFACRRLPGGGLHLEQLKAIENSHEDEHERHRPTLGGGAERRGSVARSGAHAAPHAVAAGHTAEEEAARFSREVIAWLGGSRRELGAGRMILFAPPRFLGLLRRQISADAPEMREGELSHLNAGELAVHPAVIKVMTGR